MLQDHNGSTGGGGHAGGGAGAGGGGGINAKKRNPYTRMACQYCKDKHQKCDGKQPCSNCASKNVDCLYRQERNKKRDHMEMPLNEEVVFLRNKVARWKEKYHELRAWVESQHHQHQFQQHAHLQHHVVKQAAFDVTGNGMHGAFNSAAVSQLLQQQLNGQNNNSQRIHSPPRSQSPSIHGHAAVGFQRTPRNHVIHHQQSTLHQMPGNGMTSQYQMNSNEFETTNPSNSQLPHPHSHLRLSNFDFDVTHQQRGQVPANYHVPPSQGGFQRRPPLEDGLSMHAFSQQQQILPSPHELLSAPLSYSPPEPLTDIKPSNGASNTNLELNQNPNHAVNSISLGNHSPASSFSGIDSVIRGRANASPTPYKSNAPANSPSPMEPHSFGAHHSLSSALIHTVIPNRHQQQSPSEHSAPSLGTHGEASQALHTFPAGKRRLSPEVSSSSFSPLKRPRHDIPGGGRSDVGPSSDSHHVVQSQLSELGMHDPKDDNHVLSNGEMRTVKNGR